MAPVRKPSLAPRLWFEYGTGRTCCLSHANDAVYWMTLNWFLFEKPLFSCTWWWSAALKEVSVSVAYFKPSVRHSSRPLPQLLQLWCRRSFRDGESETWIDLSSETLLCLPVCSLCPKRRAVSLTLQYDNTSHLYLSLPLPHTHHNTTHPHTQHTTPHTHTHTTTHTPHTHT